MKDYGKISVILTVYNKPQYLRECIDSVLAQTYTNWELLAMEDNSPNPEVKSILRSYNDERIRIYWSNISEEDRYKSARYATLINKAGYTMASGEYFTYLTDDDFFYPHRLERMVEELQKPDIHAVYGPQQTVDANGGLGSVRETKGILGPSTNSEGFNNIDHNSVMHDARIFFEVGGWYDVPGVWGGADAYFWRRINDAGYDFYPIEDVAPMDAKRYHDSNVQALIVRGEFFPEGKTP